MSNVSAMRKWESVACVLRQIEHRYSVADRRQQRIAVWCEDDIALSVDCSQEVRELQIWSVMAQKYVWATHTLNSVFMVLVPAFS